MAMALLPGGPSTIRRVAALAATTLVCYSYFFQAGGWNQNSRFDLARAVIEHGTLSIDSYEANTGDKARFNGHVFSDKAPGVALMAVPAIALVRLAQRLGGVDVGSTAALNDQLYAATLFTAGVPTALAMICLFALCRRHGLGQRGALFVAFTVGLCTPLWAYATLFESHALAVDLLLGALLAADILRDDGSIGRDVQWMAAIGFLGGIATVVEYPSALAALFVACYAAANVWHRRRAGSVRPAAALVVAATGCAAILALYNHAAFGAWFRLGYQYYDHPEVMHSGFFDIGRPHPRIAFEVLFGRFRGLIPLAPVLAIAAAGFAIGVRERCERPVTVLAIAVVGSVLLLNASYRHWEGGWNYGPRHMTMAIGFLAIGLALFWQRGGRMARIACVVLAIVGGTESLAAVATTAQPPDEFPAPMTELIWPKFAAGHLSLNAQSVVDFRPPEDASDVQTAMPDGSWNLGERAGLSGHKSLVPLYALVVLGLSVAFL